MNKKLQAKLLGLKDKFIQRHFDRYGYDKKGFDEFWFDRNGKHISGDTYDINGFDYKGFNQKNLHRNGTSYNDKGFNVYGFNKKGFDKRGFDSKGFDKNGFNIEGFDKDLYDVKGFHKETKQHKNGTRFNDKGFDINGYDAKGYDNQGFDINGFNVEGFNSLGYDKNGYNRKGFDKKGFDKKGFDKKGFNQNGFDKNGFDQNGYDKFGLDKDGYDKKGFDQNGYDKSGENKTDVWWRTKNTALLTKNYFDKFIKTEGKFKPKYKSASDFVNNSFNVLGLKTSSTVTDITRRGNEVKKLLAIDHNPDYEFDILHTLVSRDELSVKNAIHTLQQSEKKVIDGFFWFQLTSKLDEEAFEYLNVDKFYSGIYTWHKDYKIKKRNLSLKNLVIAETIVFSLTGSNKIQRQVIEDWYTLLKSKTTWSSYRTYFLTYDLLGVKENFFDGFEQKIKNLLSDYFFKLSEIQKNNAINKDFYEVFGFHSAKFKDRVIVPLLSSLTEIETFVRQTEKWFEKGKDANSKRIKTKAFKDIETKLIEIEKTEKLLTDYDMLEDTEVIKILDTLADTLRNTAIAVLNNTYTKKDEALGKKLLKSGKNIASSEMVKARIEKDQKDIKKGEDTKNLLNDINSQINKKNYDNALKLLNNLIKLDNSPIAWKFYNETWDYCEIGSFYSHLDEALKGVERALTNRYAYSSTKKDAIYLALAWINKLLEKNIPYAQQSDLKRTKQQLNNLLYRIY